MGSNDKQDWQGNEGFSPEARAKLLDDLYDSISERVSLHGPKLLTRGMPTIEGLQAIEACIDHLLTTRVPIELMAKLEAQKNSEEKERRRLGRAVDIAHRLVEEVRSPCTTSELHKERINALQEEFYACLRPTMG